LSFLGDTHGQVKWQSGSDHRRQQRIGPATAQRFVAEGAYVSNLNDLDRLYATIKKEKGVLHVVVANAGITELATPSTATPEHYDKTYNIIARGTFFTIQKAVPLMTTGGSIVTVGSVAYKKGLPPMTVYSSAKAAVRYSVKGWAAELIGKGIRVNNFSPGVADTPILDSQHETKEESDAMRAMYIKMTPMGRFGRPAIFYLASDESSFTTGIDLIADGGLSEF
jgi:NAD(P)-dependent dehydrogenase (short-subunit alcohol dehydrogenase family)